MPLSKQEVYKRIEDHYRENYKPLVQRLARRVGGRNNAEDILQEAYTRVLMYWEAFDKRNNIDKYFGMVIQNCIKDFIKHAKQHGMAEDTAERVDHARGPVNRIILNDVYKIIEQQPDNVMRILELYFFNQYTSKEIAALVPESQANVEQMVFVFRKNLRDRFGGRIFE